MGFGQRWPERQPRPEAKKLTAEVRAGILSAMDRAIKRSPVLSALGVQAKARRGRFYVERPFDYGGGDTGVEILGRISPLARSEDLLLEAEGRSNSWSEVAKGKIQKRMTTIENDTGGRFHGLDVLNRSLRRTGDRLSVTKTDLTFVYSKSGKKCTVQEALFHFLGVPIPVVAEPRQWYIYGRRPVIREVSKDNTRVLVYFIKDSLSGGFGGTALYMVKDGKWAVFTIKPSDSGNITAAERWIKKRGWKEWA